MLYLFILLIYIFEKFNNKKTNSFLFFLIPPSFFFALKEEEEEELKIIWKNLVDSASSHMLVSKIKPCMSKYKQTLLVKLRMAQ